MHGVKRSHQSPEAIEARKVKERSKLQGYLELTSLVLDKKKSREWSLESFGHTTRLLTQDPEFYTVWNYRRDILTHGIFPKLPPKEVNDILSEDLFLTMSFLRLHPKVYCIWNHRRWCLENIPLSPDNDPGEWKKAHWSNELYAVNKILDVDARNCEQDRPYVTVLTLSSDDLHDLWPLMVLVHAWNYRKYVVESMPIKRSEKDELDYTTRKIESNFSNFSAWHRRSKIYTAMWQNSQVNLQSIKDEEFELVKQALYVDPYDQSAWIYHRWLVGSGDDKVVLKREIGIIHELLELEPDTKWCLESLVHYKHLLIRHFKHESGRDRQSELTQECRHMLKRLEEIDPQRKRRYVDLGRQLTLQT